MGAKALYKEKAEVLGKLLRTYDIGLVYGGGNRGLMGVVAETVHTLGGRVIGVLPEALNREDVRLKVVEDQLIVVPTMHERKAKMYELADAFIALPGGIGTFEEILEVYTWLQLGYHQKPVALLNIDGFYDQLLAFLEHSCKEGFLHKDHFEALIVEQDEKTLLKRLQTIHLKLSDKLRT